MPARKQKPYVLSAFDSSFVAAAKLLVEKVLSGGAASAAQMVSAAKLLHVLNSLPKVNENLDVSLSVNGPSRTFGDITTLHWWNIRVSNGSLQLDCGGHIHQPDIGGDSFTCMIWEISPGEHPELSNFSDQLRMAPDLRTFQGGVSDVDFTSGNYSIEIGDSDNALLEEDEEEGDDSESDDYLDDIAESVAFTISPVDVVEATLAECIDVDEVHAHEADYAAVDGNCDFCQAPLDSLGLYVDGKLRGDMLWANMCARCFHARGEGIGWGKGQLFARQANGDWRLVAGFES